MREATMVRASLYIAIASLVFCLLFGAVTVFGWLSITPEMVGDAAYGVLYLLFPFLMFLFGFGFGFSSRYLYCLKRRRELEDAVAKVGAERDAAVARAEAIAKSNGELLGKLKEAEIENGVLKRKLFEGGVDVGSTDLAAQIAAALKADREDPSRLWRPDYSGSETNLKLK